MRVFVVAAAPTDGFARPLPGFLWLVPVFGTDFKVLFVAVFLDLPAFLEVGFGFFEAGTSDSISSSRRSSSQSMSVFSALLLTCTLGRFSRRGLPSIVSRATLFVQARGAAGLRSAVSWAASCLRVE